MNSTTLCTGGVGIAGSNVLSMNGATTGTLRISALGLADAASADNGVRTNIFGVRDGHFMLSTSLAGSHAGSAAGSGCNCNLVTVGSSNRLAVGNGNSGSGATSVRTNRGRISGGNSRITTTANGCGIHVSGTANTNSVTSCGNGRLVCIGSGGDGTAFSTTGGTSLNTCACRTRRHNGAIILRRVRLASCTGVTLDVPSTGAGV